MIPIAIVLIVIVVVFTVAVVVGNPGGFTMEVFPGTIPTSYTGLYLTGAAAMLVLIVALGLLWVGIRRARVKRRELAALRDAAGDRDDSLADAGGVPETAGGGPGPASGATAKRATGESSRDRASAEPGSSGSGSTGSGSSEDPSGAAGLNRTDATTTGGDGRAGATERDTASTAPGSSTPGSLSASVTGPDATPSPLDRSASPVSPPAASDDHDLTPLERDEPVRVEDERTALLDEAEETSGDEPRR